MPDFRDIINGLEEVLPILATLTGHPEIGALGSKLIQLGERELERRMAASGLDRAHELADASATYERFKAENAALKKMGHEADG